MRELTILEVPQWQGSASPTARRLRHGATELAALIPAGERVRIDVSDEPGAAEDGVAALNVLVRNLNAVRAAQAAMGRRTTLTVGGDCGVELAPVEAALGHYGTGLAVVWFDAHGDLNTPDSSPSGAFHGMVLRTLLGEGQRGLMPTRTLRPTQVVLAGVRALDPGERAFVDGNAIAHIAVPRLAEPSTLVDAVAATGAHAVYVHIDLDVLDPQLFTSVGTKEPHGLTPDQLTAAVRALAAKFAIAGLGITEYEPSHPGDQDVLVRLVDVLVPLLNPSGPGDGTAADIAWPTKYPDSANRRPGSTPSGHRSMGLVGRLLERAARATPSTVENRESGWWFRHTDNGTWWSGTVLAHGAADKLTQRIDAAERFYAEHDAVARFQVCADCPAPLDQCLSERGYRLEAPVALLTAIGGELTEKHALPGMMVRVDTSLTPDWLAVLTATGAPETDVVHETRLLRRVARPQAYVTVLAHGEPVGIGRAVADDGWTGVFNMATTPPARRRGVARLALSAIARWAYAHDAPRLYLQVEQSNDAARRLYKAAGFTQLATYHYRIRALSTNR